MPCASTTCTCWAVSPALASACRITRCWDGPFGAVSPLDAPSWLIAEPRSSASTVCPLRCASDSRSSTKTPAPSANPVPSAAEANALHRPSAASPRWRLNEVNTPGLPMIATPPASASEHSPCRRDCTARCNATSEPEQAVSTVSVGPSSPSV